ncbi:MAG TPA: hypothetical protein V6D25_03330 [Leptolyngbyaceae cyanobacterium]
MAIASYYFDSEQLSVKYVGETPHQLVEGFFIASLSPPSAVKTDN